MNSGFSRGGSSALPDLGAVPDNALLVVHPSSYTSHISLGSAMAALPWCPGILEDHWVGGVPQESDESCGPLFRSAFPEVLKATTQLGTAESDDGVGALNSPVHSGSFEPCADGYFAPGLYNARGSTQALRMEVRIAHAVSVGLEIVETATRVLGVAHLATDGGE